MTRRPALALLAAALAPALLAVTACDGGGSREQMLPASSTAGMVPIGDPAGDATRGAERIRNPYAGDPVALQHGARLYREMNCADCHGYKGEGGMGPPLVDGEWLFGDTPVDRFMSVHRGRAKGMPAYGHLLPDESIWQIVAHIEEMGRAQAAAAGQAGGSGGGRH